MPKRTSIYLKDTTAALADASDRPLAEALHRGLSVIPILTEENERGGFTVRWYCPVPAEGAKFKVLHDYWIGTDDQPIREIYEIEVTQP